MLRRLLTLGLLALTLLGGPALAQVATNLVFDTQVAPFLPNPSQPHVGFGWTDPQGTTWSTDGSSNIIASATSASPQSLLYRPGSGAGTSALTPGSQENSLNQRVKLSFVMQNLTTSNSPAIVLRSNNNNAALTGYLWLFSPNLATLRGFKTVAGTSTQIFSGTQGTLVNGNTYQMDIEATQTNGTTTTFIIKTFNVTTSTAITNTTLTDTTTQLQNPAFSGMGIDATGNGTAQIISQVQYYTDQTVNAVPAATAYTVTLASTGTTLTGQAGTITTTGLTLTSPLSVTLTSSLGSSISPNPIVLTSGQGSGAFTYTPAVAGSDVLAWTYSGGNAGMTGNGGQTETITDPVFPTDANIFWSDGWWVQSSGAYANNAGQYVNIAFTGATFSVNFDVTHIRTSSVTAAEWPTIRYSVDGVGITDLKLIDPGVNTYGLNLTGQLTGATTHTLALRLLNETQAFNRWTPNASGLPPSGLKISNFIVASGASTVPLAGTYLAPKGCSIYVFSDSIGEGAKTSWPNPTITADSEATWTNAVAANQNCELSNYAFSGQAYSGQIGVPDVPVFGSAWNLRFSGQTKLSSGHFITNSGSALPKYVIVNMGTNDAANSASKTVGSVKAVITAIRAAAPSATIFLVLPFAYHSTWFSAQGYGAFLLSEYQSYIGGDTNAFLIDPGQAASLGLNNYPAGASNTYSADGLHPGGQRSVNLGAVLSQQIRAALPVTGGGTGAPIYYPCRRPRGPARRNPSRRSVAARRPRPIPSRRAA